MPTKPICSEDVILHRLVSRRPRQISLRSLLIGCAVAPIVLWLLYSTSTQGSTIGNAMGKRALQADRLNDLGSEPTIARYAIPAAVVCLTGGALTMIVVMSLGQRAARVLALTVGMTALVALLVIAIVVALNGYGFRDVRRPNPQDLTVAFAIPVAIALLVGSVLGWAVVETE